MATKAQIDTLTRRHQELDAAITAEVKNPAFDELRVVELKRKKLRLKDQMAEISTDTNPH